MLLANGVWSLPRRSSKSPERRSSSNTQANVICSTLIDPTALKFLQLEYPLPNVPLSTVGTNGGLVNNFVGSAPITGAQNQFNARVDYNLGRKDQLLR